MPPAETDPIEKRSYTKIFFITGTIFCLMSVWAFYDEVIGRRSWKGYQREFNALELKKVETEYDQAKKAIEQQDNEKDKLPEGSVKDEDLSLRRIRLKIEEAQVKMDGPEFKKAQNELADRQIILGDAKQEYGFTKADQDEIYYEWKHALEEGHAKEAGEYKKKYYALDEEMKAIKVKVDAAEARVDEVQKTLNVYFDDLKKWQAFEKKKFEPLVKLEKKIDGIKARTHDIRQTVVDDLGKGGIVVWGTVDRCESCHAAINRDGFENEKQPFKTHPHRQQIFGKHPIDEFGCTTCHGGQGRATQIKHKPFEEGDFAHGYAHHWTDPLLRGDAMQSTCNKCHQDQWKLDYAPVYMQGKKIFWDLGCTGCHAVKGFENAPRAGPSLRRVADKVNEEWLYHWIKNPKEYLPHTKMPVPPLDIEAPNQIEKVAAYILQSSEPFNWPYGKYAGNGNAEQGQKTFETIGCLGCHTMGSKGTGLAPALDRITMKTSADWIYNWIQNPKAFSPEATMPSLRLSQQEASDITAYLIRHGEKFPENAELRSAMKDPENAKTGFLLISQFGCYGCHNIKGFEDASKLSVELTTFGRKDILELDFGDTHINRTWADWTFNKIKTPRVYLTEKTSSKMPTFNLSDERINSLVVFLRGLKKKEEVPERFIPSVANPVQHQIDEGRRLIDDRNCKGCHLIEGEGRLIEAVTGEGKAPPILDGMGARVRPDWMFKFLKDPSFHKIRPWLDVRMPTFQFSDEEINTVIRYFAGRDSAAVPGGGKVSPGFSTIPPTKFDPHSVEAGALLASTNYFSCFTCHIQNGRTPPSAPEQWGPDLSYARERIRYEFIPEWVKDPQVFTPGVKMPGFLPSDDAAPQDVLGGNRQSQAEALRDYLMSLGAAKQSLEAAPGGQSPATSH